jgi:glycogen synthase
MKPLAFAPTLTPPDLLTARQKQAQILTAHPLMGHSISSGASKPLFGAVANDTVTLTKPTESSTVTPRDVSHPGELKFATDSGKTAIYATSEVAFPGYPSSGGLGIVSAQTPSALNNFYGKDVRVIMPASSIVESLIKDPKEGWQDTHETIKLHVPWADYQKDYQGDREAEFKVYQKTFDDYKVPTYAIVSHSKIINPYEFASNTPNHYVGISDIPNDKLPKQFKSFMDVYTKDLDQGNNQVMLLVDQALAELAKRLDPTKYTKSEASQLRQFDQKLDHWIVNDWITGPMDCMKELPKDVGVTFITHNTYDKTVPKEAAQAFGLPRTSLLQSAMEKADVVIVNNDFLKTCTETKFLDIQKRDGVKDTMAQLAPDRVFNMYHGYGEEFNPHTNPVLKGDVNLTPKRYELNHFVAKHGPKEVKSNAPIPQKKDWGFSELTPYQAPAHLSKTFSKPIVQQVLQPLRPTVIPLEPTFKDHFIAALQTVLSVLSLGFYQPVPLAKKFDALNVKQHEAAQVTYTADVQRAQANYAIGADRSITTDEAKHLLAWKQQNKTSLQKWLGLKPDPQAVMFVSTSRLDVAQKMGNVVMNTLVPFMESHPHAQFVGIYDYNGNNEANNRLLAEAGAKFPDRFRVLPFDMNTSKLIVSAGDFSLMPSAYEPYGTGQLQASAMGCLPISNDVDGLHQSVSDPSQNRPYMPKPGEPEHQPVESYGQTGFFINRITGEDWLNVCGRVDEAEKRLKKGETLSVEHVAKQLKGTDKLTWLSAHDGLNQAMEKAYTVRLHHPEQFALMAKNGMDFVLNEHSWESVAGLYNAPLAKAMAMAQQRQATSGGDSDKPVSSS